MIASFQALAKIAPNAHGFFLGLYNLHKWPLTKKALAAVQMELDNVFSSFLIAKFFPSPSPSPLITVLHQLGCIVVPA